MKMNIKMKVFKWLFLFCWITVWSAEAQDVYRTNVDSKLIKSLQVKVAGELISEPFIELNGDNVIEFNFDALQQGGVRYAYSIIHCNADWTQSSLAPIEYMNGFQGLSIDDFATSINTTVQYTNYQLLLPNSDIQFKVSGNYVLKVYNENTPNKTIFTACFSVVEPSIIIQGIVSGNTDIDFNQGHQQVSFTINHPNYQIQYPETDLKIYVYQNNRRDNAVTNLMPMTILDGQITYDHNRNLIFEAGNEYRRFEFLSNMYTGLGVNSISFHNPYYHVELLPDYSRANKAYQYDQDQDGRFFIRCSNCNDPDTEADYYIVHFTLVMDEIPGGDVYICGDLFHNVFNNDSKMDFNTETNQYEKSVLLKQGSYNFLYLFVPDGATEGETAAIAGNYYQAENEYTIAVFHRPIGTRYDRLIGVKTIKNQMTIF